MFYLLENSNSLIFETYKKIARRTDLPARRAIVFFLYFADDSVVGIIYLVGIN